MLTKVLTGGFILIMIGALVAGAIAVFSPSEEAHAQANERETRFGQGAQAETGVGRGQGVSRQGQGQGLGQSQGQGFGQGQGQSQALGQSQGWVQGQGRGREGSESEVAPLEQTTLEGIVVETDELFIETAAGETVQVGLGPSTYRESLGFVLKPGDRVRVSGYWEDGEFKAIQLENQTTGQSIVLRDPSGRPMWAGQGRGKNRSA